MDVLGLEPRERELVFCQTSAPFPSPNLLAIRSLIGYNNFREPSEGGGVGIYLPYRLTLGGRDGSFAGSRTPNMTDPSPGTEPRLNRGGEVSLIFACFLFRKRRIGVSKVTKCPVYFVEERLYPSNCGRSPPFKDLASSCH